MQMPQTTIAVIECPHCGTRYQVPTDSLGPHGREVQCATCTKSWQAESGAGNSDETPETAADRLFDAAAEQEMDAAFADAEREATAADEPTGDGADAATRADRTLRNKRNKAFTRRQDSIARKLPLARVRRSVRIVSITVLAGLVAGGLMFRTEIVRAVPDLAGVYQGLGLGVNVLGLEFREVTTLLSLSNGAPVLRVDARIDSIASHTIAVPPVVVSLLDAAGTSLYEWSVSADAPDLAPDEAVAFSTQLNAPPAAATQVRLSFANSQAQSPASAPTEITTRTP